MSREIKFRAWDKEEHRFADIHNRLAFTVDGIVVYIEEFGRRISNVTGRYEIEQYTGLKDKNGVEIYEGDIVRSFSNINKVSDPHLSRAEPTYRNTSVEFYNGAFRLTCEEFPHGCGILNNYSGAMTENIEVIGNIYENKDLLEDK